MTNDEKITTIAKLLREMSEEMGARVGATFYRAGDLYAGAHARLAVSFGEGSGVDDDPAIALTKALSEHERTAADAALKAEIEDEFKARKARLAQKEAA